MGDGLLRIGEVASRAGVSTRTVDFYTGLGLVTPAGRTGGNFRLYEAATVDRIAAIRRLEASGVSLDDIARATQADRVAEDVAVILRQFQLDLDHLQVASRAAQPDAQGLLAAITARAHSLIATALEIAGGQGPAGPASVGRSPAGPASVGPTPGGSAGAAPGPAGHGMADRGPVAPMPVDQPASGGA